MADDVNEQTWRITVDSSVCIGSGMCAGIAPAHFHLVDHRSQPKQASVGPDDDVIDATENCPVEAIAVHDEKTGDVVAPREP